MPKLTARQRQVILLVAEGYSNPDIGKKLRIHLHTVKQHVKGIMDTTGMHTRVELTTWAIANGLYSVEVERMPDERIKLELIALRHHIDRLIAGFQN